MANGDIYVPSGAPEIRDTFLRDIRLAAIANGVAEPPITPGTDWYFLGEACANLALVGYANGAISDDAQNILRAVGQDLEDWRVALGLDEVSPAGSTGKIKITVYGPTTLTNGTRFLLPNGLRGEVVGNYVNPVDGREVDVRAVDKGVATNVKGDTTVRFISPPPNIDEEATVSVGSPMTGGFDKETDGRKRGRILNELRNKPAGGNWAHIRKIARDGLGSLDECCVYPGAGGPASCLVVPTRDYDVENSDFTRTVSDAALQTVRGLIHANLPNPQEIVVRAAADEDADFTLLVEIPSSTLLGGDGRGWVDQLAWPNLVGGDSNRVTVSAVSQGNDTITVTAATTVAPYPGQTHIAWWSSVDRKFQVALVIGVSGSSGAWVLTLDRPLVSSDSTGPGIGDYICPAASNTLKYGEKWVEEFRALGPGEITSDIYRLPRARRHPFTSDERPSSITRTVVGGYVKKFGEISDWTLGYAPKTTPTIPANVSLPPNILRPRHFAIYAI